MPLLFRWGWVFRKAHKTADIYLLQIIRVCFRSSIEGSYLPRNDLNRVLYKQDLNSEDILKSDNPRDEIKNILKIIENVTGEKSEKQ